ncbi:MAG: helix-turn-helix domain-containing protein [Thermoanaerobaculia bacterium]
MAAAVVPAALVPPIELLVAHQASYTVLAAIVRFRGRGAVRCHGSATTAVLAVVLAVHAAQAVRIASRGAPVLADVVPATLSLALLGCGAAPGVVWIAHQGSGRSRSGPRRASARGAAGARDQEADLLRRLDRLMDEEHLYRSADLGLHDLAAALEVTPHRLSEALNGTRGVSLTHYLARFRVEDARRRLRDPGHAIVTIEAIGQRSGFGSRSAFYSVFRRETGTTPARFRAAERPGVPSRSS